VTTAQLQQTEAQFQEAIIDYARALGWLIYHTHDSRYSAAGFPDLVMVHRGESTQTVPRNCRLVFAELKTEKGRTSEAQARWLEALGVVLARGGAMEFQEPRSTVHLWRPSDWPEIERVLRR
jgi:hypothetical protein